MLVDRTLTTHMRQLGGALIVALSALAAGPAFAEDGFHPLDSALEFMNLKAHPEPMPDFVQASRPASGTTGYMPVGARPPDHALKTKTPAEVKAATAELDAARAAQQAGKRPKPPGSPAVKPALAKPAVRKTATDH